MAISIALLLFLSTAAAGLNRSSKIERIDAWKDTPLTDGNGLIVDYVNSEGSNKHKLPQITKETLEKVLFNSRVGYEPSHFIFDIHVHHQIVPGLFERTIVRRVEGTNTTVDQFFNSASSPLVEEKVAVVADPSIPIRVCDRISYFLGAENLTSNIFSNCAEVYTANDNGILDFCDVESKTKCTRDLTPVLNGSDSNRGKDRIKKFLLPDGKQLRDITWFCAAGSVCCGWECCLLELTEDKPKKREWTIGEYYAMILGVSCLAVAICTIPFFVSSYLDGKRMRTQPVEIIDARGNLRTLHHRSFDYPKQLRQMGMGDSTDSLVFNWLEQNEIVA